MQAVTQCRHSATTLVLPTGAVSRLQEATKAAQGDEGCHRKTGPLFVSQHWGANESRGPGDGGVLSPHRMQIQAVLAVAQRSSRLPRFLKGAIAGFFRWPSQRAQGNLVRKDRLPALALV